MSTDSKCLFDVVTKNSSTLEKRLMIDISATREYYKRGEISELGHVLTSHNPADAFTKEGKCAALEAILATSHDTNPINQWVHRDTQATDAELSSSIGNRR